VHSTNRRRKWRKSKKNIGEFQTIELDLAKDRDGESYEQCLRLRHGEIWEFNSTHYACVVDSNIPHTNIIKKKLGLVGTPCKKGDELKFLFPRTELPKVVEIVGPQLHVEWAIKKANDFGRPQ
jgi:hypothetical protein